MATHSSMLAWRSPWTEVPGGLQSLGLQKSQTCLATKHKQQLKVAAQETAPQSALEDCSEEDGEEPGYKGTLLGEKDPKPRNLQSNIRRFLLIRETRKMGASSRIDVTPETRIPAS